MLNSTTKTLRKIFGSFFFLRSIIYTVSSTGIWNPGTQKFFSSTRILKSRYPGFFRVPGFWNPGTVPRIFFQYQDLNSGYPGFFSGTVIWNPGTRDFFYCGVWSLFGDLFFFNYFFGKKFIKKNCHQKVTKLCSKNLLKSRYPGFSHMAPPNKDASEGFSSRESGYCFFFL